MIWPVTAKEQREAMAKMWNIFPVGQEDPIHLRAIWGKGVPCRQPIKNITFNANYYHNVADRQRAFEEKAIELNKLGYNVYTCFNPISPDFKGDEHNGLAVTDADIACRRYLLIDIDRDQTGQPATDDEIASLFGFAFDIEIELFHVWREEPITVGSGNGVHIYLPINMPNGEDEKVLCQRMLQALAGKYDTSTVKVDTSVYNASRITKVPGTVARKGIEVPDPTGFNERYYRMASVVE